MKRTRRQKTGGTKRITYIAPPWKIIAVLHKLDVSTEDGWKQSEEGLAQRKRERGDGCYSPWYADQARSTRHRARLYLSRRESGPEYKIL